MQDVECPYCEAWQSINHDDGYGCQEDETYQQQCADCEKMFTYTTRISFSYDAEKAPCLNNEAACNYQVRSRNKIPGSNRVYIRLSCEWCGDEKERIEN